MFGLSDHDLMFGHGADTGDDQDVEVEAAAAPETDYIQHRVRGDYSDYIQHRVRGDYSVCSWVDYMHGKED